MPFWHRGTWIINGEIVNLTQYELDVTFWINEDGRLVIEIRET